MWTPEHPTQVHFRFLDAQARHRANPANLSVFERTPSLSDDAWITRIRERLAEHVRHHAPYRPLYYSLGDEPGIVRGADPDHPRRGGRGRPADAVPQRPGPRRA